jgi:hypothetical protein
MFTSGGSVFPEPRAGTHANSSGSSVSNRAGSSMGSSLEIKRLIYFGRPRYRYASAPALSNAAVFFKSGSFFQCRPEPGFTCKAYAGNETNIMNSVAIVESGSRIYLVTLMSNILRTNSAVEHQRIAGLVEKLVQSSTNGLQRR